MAISVARTHLNESTPCAALNSSSREAANQAVVEDEDDDLERMESVR